MTKRPGARTAQRLPASLTRFDAALAALLDKLEPVRDVELPPREALDCVVAELAIGPHPQHDIAQADGWALRARDLVGASSYTPLPLTTQARWVEAGDPIPADCDCVIDADAIDQTGPIQQVLTEAPPGHGVRRKGGDFPDGFVVAPGRQLRPLDITLACRAGVTMVKVRRPKLHVVNVPALGGDLETAQLILESARGAGADVTFAEAKSREVGAIGDALEVAGFELIITVGGSGVGRTDATVAAIAQRGHVIAHGLALRPGTTSAIGRIGSTPVIALPGSSADALAAWWTLALPALDRLSGREPGETVTLPLARKLASSVGIAEIALLKREGDSWMPLALGDLSLQAIFQAGAWLRVPGSSEGFAAGTPVCGKLLR